MLIKKEFQWDSCGTAGGTGLVYSSTDHLPANPFRQGNQLWRLRSRAGPQRRFSTPDALWDACCQYFEWNENTPLWSEKVFFRKGKAVRVQVQKMRAMTLSSLVSFLGINIRTWAKWRASRPDLGPVIACVEAVIWVQKFNGVAVGFLNVKIIARDLGLVKRRF